MSRSYDGGLTWSGAFLPGGPFDASPASLAAPVYGLQAATDPVVGARALRQVLRRFHGVQPRRRKQARRRSIPGPQQQRGRRLHRLPGDDGRRVGQQRHQRLLPRQARHRGRRLPRLQPRHLRRSGLCQLLDLQRSRQGRQVPEQGQLRQLVRRRTHLRHPEAQPALQPEPGLGPRRGPHGRHDLHDLAPLLGPGRHPHGQVRATTARSGASPSSSPALCPWRPSTSRRSPRPWRRSAPPRTRDSRRWRSAPTASPPPR